MEVETKFISPPKYVPAKSDKQSVFEVTGSLSEQPEDKFDWRSYLDLALFIFLSVGGIYLIYTSKDVPDSTSLFGGLFFNGGFNPLIVSTWAVFTGSVLFRKMNAIKMLSSAIIFGIGYWLLMSAGEEDTARLIGGAFFEVGALFFVSKFFFLGEDSELVIERLEKQLAEAQQSAGMGMALSYYYNFVLPTCANLRDATTPIDMEIEKGKFTTYQLEHSQLLVFVPRDLDGSDMKAFLRDISSAKAVIQGKPLENRDRSSHRPMFVYFFKWNTEQLTCDGLFDIPTIISSIYDRAKDQKDDKDSLDFDTSKELLTFQNHLISLIKSNPLTVNHVRVISVPPLPFKLQELKNTAERVLSSEPEPVLI